jgi:hypothetical protein
MARPWMSRNSLAQRHRRRHRGGGADPRAAVEPQGSGHIFAVSDLPSAIFGDYRAAANAAGSGDEPRVQTVFGSFNLLMWLISSSRVAKPAK